MLDFEVTFGGRFKAIHEAFSNYLNKLILLNSLEPQYNKRSIAISINTIFIISIPDDKASV